MDFLFAKGYLETADASKVEYTIGEVFTMDTSASEAQQAAATEHQPEQAAAAQPAQAQAPAASIELGQTIGQVVAALGQPEKLADPGNEEIYTYKNLKVIFLNGKVADVQ